MWKVNVKMVTLNLDKIFNPQSVAIIGASDSEGSVGYAIVKNFTRLGYAGKVYFVNNRKPEILGTKSLPIYHSCPRTRGLGDNCYTGKNCARHS